MNMLNQVILEGKIGTAYGQGTNGGFVEKFTVVNERTITNLNGEKDVEKTSVKCQMWGNSVRNIEKYFKAEKGVRIVGRLFEDKTYDSEYNLKNVELIVIVEHIEFKPF